MSYPAGVRRVSSTREFRCCECGEVFELRVDLEFGRVFAVDPEDCPECGNPELELA